MNFFFKFINYFKQRKINKQIIRSLSYGDIIWCDVRIYNTIKFKKNHTNRPYFVVEITDKYIKCIPFTHKTNHGFFCFKVNDNYGSLILSNGIFSLKYNKFKNVSSKEKLTEFEISKITKRLFIYYKHSPELSIFSRYIKLQPNDIVVHDDKYCLLYEVKNSTYILYEFSKYQKPSYVKVDTSFFVNPTSIVVSDASSLTYFNTFKDYKVLSINNYFKSLKTAQKKNKKSKKNAHDKRCQLSLVDIGTLVSYKNHNYYYIGSINKKGCLVDDDYSSSTWLDDDIDVRRLGRRTTEDELCFLKNMFFQK